MIIDGANNFPDLILLMKIFLHSTSLKVYYNDASMKVMQKFLSTSGSLF